jgi:hypothetical protein
VVNQLASALRFSDTASLERYAKALARGFRRGGEDPTS